jgi:hypothetical protein
MNLRLASVAIALVLSTMLLGASVYQSVVDAPNYHGGPVALEHARGFYHAVNPGVFFRTIAPGSQLLLLIAIVCNWKPTRITRWRLVGGLALLILADVVTFRFHYPRNSILFVAPLTNTSPFYDRVATEWATGNYVRDAMVSITVVLLIVSMIRVARETARDNKG